MTEGTPTDFVISERGGRVIEVERILMSAHELCRTADALRKKGMRFILDDLDVRHEAERVAREIDDEYTTYFLDSMRKRGESGW